MKYTIGTKVFGDWEIKREIGAGGFGVVYEIEKNNYGILVKSALKVIRIPASKSEIKTALSEGMDERSMVSYFEGCVDEIVKEIAVMSSLKNHPNIVTYEDHHVERDSEEFGWHILIRMELLTPLQDYQLSHKMTEKEIVQMARDICNALVYCQQKQIIHRDIKPENIFINELGEYKLGDFGVARSLDKTKGGLSVKGTIGYMAPEVYLGQSYGVSVDTYSVGLMMYRMLNGNRMPFFPPAPNPITYQDKEIAMTRRMQGESFPPPMYGSEGLKKVILKACAYHPSNRYKTAWEMLEALNFCNQNDFVETGERIEKRIQESPEPIITYEEEKGSTIGLWENSSLKKREEIYEKDTTNRNKWEEEVGEFITEKNERENRIKKEKKARRKKIFGIITVSVIFMVILVSGMTLGQKELERAEYEESEIIEEVGEKKQEIEEIIPEVGEELDFELTQEEKEELNELAKEFMMGLQSKTMGEDYAEVWEAINSLYGYPENIEIGEIEEIEFFCYEDGSIHMYVPVWGDGIFMGTESMLVEDGKRIYDTFYLEPKSTYMHKALESEKIYLDDEEIHLGKTTLDELNSLWWIDKIEESEEVDEERYLIWKDEMEDEPIGVYVKEGIITGIFLDSAQVYRFRFDDAKAFLGDMSRMEIVNSYGIPDSIDTTCIVYYGKNSFLSVYHYNSREIDIVCKKYY